MTGRARRLSCPAPRRAESAAFLSGALRKSAFPARQKAKGQAGLGSGGFPAGAAQACKGGAAPPLSGMAVGEGAG